MSFRWHHHKQNVLVSGWTSVWMPLGTMPYCCVELICCSHASQQKRCFQLSKICWPQHDARTCRPVSRHGILGALNFCAVLTEKSKVSIQLLSLHVKFDLLLHCMAMLQKCKKVLSLYKRQMWSILNRECHDTTPGEWPLNCLKKVHKLHVPSTNLFLLDIEQQCSNPIWTALRIADPFRGHGATVDPLVCPPPNWTTSKILGVSCNHVWHEVKYSSQCYKLCHGTQMLQKRWIDITILGGLDHLPHQKFHETSFWNDDINSIWKLRESKYFY